MARKPSAKPPENPPEKPPADDKKKDEAGEKKLTFLQKLKRPKVIWSVIGVFALSCSIALILMIILFSKLGNEKSSHLDNEFTNLRRDLAIGLKNAKLNFEKPSKIADEVVKLPEYIAQADKYLKDRKAQYRSVFTKGSKSAGGWRLFGKSLYYISEGEKSWYDAENFCMSKDAHLTSLLSDEEQEYITSLLKEPAWIGLTDENEEGNWEWTDGSRLEAEYWSHGKPSRAMQYGAIENDCTYIVPSPSDLNWMDANCNDHKRWVCKESLDVREP